MTLAHFLYIPGVLLVGLVLGWWLGGRAADTAHRDRQESADRRADRRAASEARPRAE